MAYPKKSVAIFGLGKAGVAASERLGKKGCMLYFGDDSEVADKKITKPEEMPWDTINTLVLSPGVPLTHPKPHEVVLLAKKAGARIISDVDVLYEDCPNARYIGITGTNGKSTTTALTHHILKNSNVRSEVGGNIGIAASALPDLDKDGTYVLEVSSYQLDLIDLVRFNIAVWINITPDHIDRHGDMAGYVAAKRRIFKNQQAGDVAIIGVDDDYSYAEYQSLLKAKKQRVIAVTINPQKAKTLTDHEVVWAEENRIHHNASGKKASLELGVLKTLPGMHNRQNIGMAFAACLACGVSPDKIIAAVKTFPGLAHRMEWVEEIDGITYINDSKATNADATSHALKSYADILWIAGGVPKAGGIEPLQDLFSRIAHAYLIGNAAKEFATTLEGKVPYTHSGTLEQSVADATNEARARFKKTGKLQVVLLSPACASFDAFKNFEHRGECFRKFVAAQKKQPIAV